jgi:polyhydroxyalkanoate synthesis regulator phasin
MPMLLLATPARASSQRATIESETTRMPQPLERLMATGKQLSETGRSQAQQLRDDLVEQGRLATDQISAVVEQLVNPVGRYRGEDLRQTMHAEVQQAVRSLGSEMREHLVSQSQGVGDQIAAVAENLRDTVRREVQWEISALGLATKDDLLALRHAIVDDLTAALHEQPSAAALPPTPSELDTGGGADESLHEAVMQMTPPHQRPTIIEPPTG